MISSDNLNILLNAIKPFNENLCDVVECEECPLYTKQACYLSELHTWILIQKKLLEPTQIELGDL